MAQQTPLESIQYIVQGRNEFFGSKAKSKLFSKADYQDHATHTICMSGLEAAFGNAVWQKHLPLTNEKEVEHILKQFKTRNLPFFWWEAPYPIESDMSFIQQFSQLPIDEILTGKGLQVGGLLKGISLHLNHASDISPISHVHVKQVQTTQELKSFCQLVFSIHEAEAELIEQAYQLLEKSTHAGEDRHYLAYKNHEIVGGITLATGQAAGLWNFATLPSVRKQGVGSALIQTAIKEAQQHHYQDLMAILLPSEMTTLWNQFNFKEICYFPFYISNEKQYSVKKEILN